MAYVSSLTHGARIPVGTFVTAGEYVLKAPIGFDDRTGAVYGIFVCFASIPGFPERHYELVFHLTKAEGDDDPSTYWDGQDTRAWIADPDARALILSVIVRGVIDLVRIANPELLTMTTYQSHLPEKALRKYAAVTEAVERCGYTIEEMEEWHGQLGWKMHRNP